MWGGGRDREGWSRIGGALRGGTDLLLLDLLCAALISLCGPYFFVRPLSDRQTHRHTH
jgi:hypothetical protein